MLKLYNTQTRSVDLFQPIQENCVEIYTCGPTVYHYAHIGNLRTYIFEDILKRVLLRRNYLIKHVMNITDVGHLTDDADLGEDKMEVGAKREGKTVWDIAEHYTKAFISDLHKLNIIEPDIWCKATDHIPEQIDMVKQLERKGVVYQLTDGLYYDTSTFPDYGKMAGLDLEGLQAGSRIEQTEGKRSASDFCVWKFSPPGVKRLMEWESPWGTGFPGWHLECSAMALKYLGETFDIHCGGIDHVRVHHTNEIAQTEAVTGKKWVNWWMHGEFLLMDEGKMSKSADNFLTIDGLVKKGYDPLSYRMYLMSAHYRKALIFNFEALDGAQKALSRLKMRAANLPAPQQGDVDTMYLQRFDDSLDEDLNMPQALSHMWMMLQDKTIDPQVKANTLQEMDSVLQLKPFEQLACAQEDITDEGVLSLIEERTHARANKDFARSDAIRDQLSEMGVEIKDGPEGTTFSRK